VYEALGAFVAIILAGLASRIEFVARRDGAAVYVALALWAIVRFGVAFVWRDPLVAEVVRMEQLLALVVLVVAVLGLVERARAPLQPLVERRRGMDAEPA
jgi:hypothetical protein